MIIYSLNDIIPLFEYIERVSKALIMFFKPSWDHGFGVEENKETLKGYINFFYLESLRLKFENFVYKIPNNFRGFDVCL